MVRVNQDVSLNVLKFFFFFDILVSNCLKKKIFWVFVARISGSQDELDDESVQGKHHQFDNFSIFSSE